MTIPKGKTMQDAVPKKDVSTLKKRVQEYEALINETREELKLREEMLAFQKKYPKKLDPEFEYEGKDEWSAYLIKQWEYNFAQNKRALEYNLDDYTQKKILVEQEIEEDE